MKLRRGRDGMQQRIELLPAAGPEVVRAAVACVVARVDPVGVPVVLQALGLVPHEEGP